MDRWRFLFGKKLGSNLGWAPRWHAVSVFSAAGGRSCGPNLGEPRRPGPKGPRAGHLPCTGRERRPGCWKGNRGRAAVAKEPVPRGPYHGASSLFSMVWGRGQETADRVLASQGASHAGRAGGDRPTQEPPRPGRPARRLSRTVAATVAGLPWGPPAPSPGDLARGGVLHRLDWQQDMVVRDPSTVLLMA